MNVVFLLSLVALFALTGMFIAGCSRLTGHQAGPETFSRQKTSRSNES